ncbi:hypothetical protein ARMGADRAFT_1091521 [Armillaria gallica]|uniref:Uncharacterized protein n=1 Tax=Armillaria gallica TaxID=47427 RepID=A0A2H3CH96_ARMGA|nr:hypothetical protein ARMGADRAFT_1091521 [Armillaria gallica]
MYIVWKEGTPIHFLANDQHEFAAAVDLILVPSLGYPRFLNTNHAGKHGREFLEFECSNGRLRQSRLEKVWVWVFRSQPAINEGSV